MPPTNTTNNINVRTLICLPVELTVIIGLVQKFDFFFEELIIHPPPIVKHFISTLILPSLLVPVK